MYQVESLGTRKAAVWFTSLDCLSGYHQIAMDPMDKEKTAFTCHAGLNQVNVMPFE